MSKKVKVHDGTLDDMGKRFASAWHRLEGGERVHEDVETLAASGLVQRKDGHVSASYDAISAEMRL